MSLPLVIRWRFVQITSSVSVTSSLVQSLAPSLHPCIPASYYQSICCQVTKEDDEVSCLFPSLSKIREVSAKIAADIVEEGYKCGLATKMQPKNIQEAVRMHMYQPAVGPVSRL